MRQHSAKEDRNADGFRFGFQEVLLQKMEY